MKMRIAKNLLSAFLMAALLGACGKKNRAEEEAPPAASGQEENIVTLSAESLKNMDLKIEPVRVGPLDMKTKVPGRITADANRTAKVSATLEGRIVKLTADVGDQVYQGQILGLLESPELLDKALALKAPVAGVIMEKSLAVGELAEKGKGIFTISDPRFIWLIGEVKEQEIAMVKAHQPVDFTVPAYPEEIFHGKVARVGNVIETDSRTFEIRVELDNRNGKLKPGMFADIQITTRVVLDAVLVSDAALQTEGGEQILFVAMDGNRFEKRVVQPGMKQEGTIQILDGLKAGEKVVTEGSFTLKSEMLKGELGEE
ncbi:MAG: efflux RND transporter periplasmic adaptor subunit [Fibrobacteria bacterium]